jgi:hypothetical protein
MRSRRPRHNSALSQNRKRYRKKSLRTQDQMLLRTFRKRSIGCRKS